MVVGSKRTLGKNRFPKKTLDKRTTDLLVELAKDVSPGRRGGTASTMARSPGSKGAGLRWLHAAVLPDEVSRHNSPSRAELIRAVLAGLDTGNTGKVAILLVLDEADHYLAAANAVSRAFPRYTTKSSPSKARVQLAAITTDGTEVEATEQIEMTVELARDSAELVDTPPSELNPDELSRRAQEMLKALKGVKVKEIKGDKLLEQGFAGIHAVGRGALTPPRLLIASYPGTDDGELHVVLVGKGITFDTGGLHIKPRGGMEKMKGDMGGAAAVLGAFRALVRSGCPHQVTLLLCIAENAVDQQSYKPDDILRLHSGKTVEINNTDAEGRLVMADGMSYAARDLEADVIIDAATLTGAQLVATGVVHAAVVSNDEELEQLAVTTGRQCGDLVHPLPFAPELFHKEFSSPVADMRNSVANRMNAQSSCAGQFLYAQIEDAPGASRRRWCHIDLAGPSLPKDRATGFGVALIAGLVGGL